MLISNHQILSFYIVLVIIGFLRCRDIYACPFLWNLWISITCPKPFLFNLKNHKTSLVGRFGNYTWLSFMSDMQKLFCGIRKHYACILPIWYAYMNSLFCRGLVISCWFLSFHNILGMIKHIISHHQYIDKGIVVFWI